MSSLPTGSASGVDSVLRFIERASAGVANRTRVRRDARRLGTKPAAIGDSLRDGYAAGWEGVPCAFVLSTGRVGSKTMAALWGSSPGVLSHHEPVPRMIHASALAWPERGEGDRWRDLVLAARDDLVAGAWRRGLVYAESNNRLTSLAPALASAFPSARFLHLYRHPYDFVRSGMRRRWYQGHHWDFARFEPRADDPLHAGWPDLDPVEKIAWLWAATNQFALEWTAANSDRATGVRAEELFRMSSDAVEAAFAAVNARPPASRTLRGALRDRMNTQRSGSFPAPEEWDADLRNRVDDRVGETAARLGIDL